MKTILLKAQLLELRTGSRLQSGPGANAAIAHSANTHTEPRANPAVPTPPPPPPSPLEQGLHSQLKIPATYRPLRVKPELLAKAWGSSRTGAAAHPSCLVPSRWTCPAHLIDPKPASLSLPSARSCVGPEAHAIWERPSLRKRIHEYLTLRILQSHGLVST